MALAVCVLFDARTERRIRELWARLESRGVHTLATHTHGRHHPHLSYAVLREWDLEAVHQAVDRLPDGGPFTLTCQGTLAFPRGRAALAPSLTAELARRQESVVAAVRATGADLHRNYAEGAWVPHVSLATRAPGALLPVVVAAVADVLPMPLVVNRAALVDSGTGETVVLPRIP
ncbi:MULTISPECIES: 2'-5' RNA ligase family protein [Mumia]|uniref:2'-5' RNA ligase family protein n=1 Tax=Mumia TaxID=1546255 RepID=UPI00141F2C88|nr:MULTISPECIES: 2'-5' RNA ligase family protein [unclassified Mumia]QMW65737.1 2'-5' RNA ligase family protein [Mumia sp. ZJ1417]